MIYDAHKYGFGCIYWITVSGVPVVWIERVTGKALPAGYTTEDASLVIDDSAEVGIEQIDRDRGTAVSLSFGFKLLDTAEARDWMRRWSDQATLTTTLTVGGAVATVDSTTGWPGAGAFYAGLERITYTGTTATTFTGCTRGTAGSLAYEHKPGTTAQIITDRPRFWRGREVVLWATPVDASGYVAGSNLTDDAVQVWRGRIEAGPDRDVDGFVFQAQSLDRVLDQPLATQVTGTVADTSVKYAAKPGTQITVSIEAYDAAGVQQWAYVLEMLPFAAYTAGDMLSADAMRELIIAAWDNAVTAAGANANLSSMRFYKDKTIYTTQVKYLADAAINKIAQFVQINGTDVTSLKDPILSGTLTEIWIDLWKSAGDPSVPWSVAEPAGLNSLTVHVDEGDPADVPTTGMVWLGGNGVKYSFVYQYAATDGFELYLGGVIQGGYGTAPKLTPAQAVGMTATVQLVTAGSFPTLMLTTLENSGTGQRGTYDTGPRGKGYGIDDSAIDEDSFLSAAAPLGSMTGTLIADGSSFSERLGGALGLFRMAVACRPDTSATYRALKLTLVHTSPFGAGWTTTIVDADLLSHEGDPVVSVRRADSANTVKVLRKVGDSEDVLTATDRDQVDAVGSREATYMVPADDRETLFAAALPAIASHFASDQTAQAVEVRVPPWVLAEVGDIVEFVTTHPAVWTWNTSPGQVGYDGPARVVGKRMNLKTSQVTLTLLIGGGVKVRALSPAAEVQAFDVAAAPTRIDVPLKYLSHFAQSITEAGGPVKVLHYYRIGPESDIEGYTISAAAENAGLCRLTVSAITGAPVLSLASESYLTLPTVGGGDLTAYQATFAHIDDGTQWG